MFKDVDLYTQRYIQIVLMCIVAQTIYLYSNIPHSIWIVISVCGVYGGFSSGAVIKKAYHRLTGTVTGIALVVIIWHLIHWDYRLLLVLTTLWIPLFVFFILIPYNRFVILATAFSDIMSEWSNSSSFSVYYYVMDRFICVFIVFSLCICIEHFWFGRKDLSYLNFKQTQKNILKNLKQLYALSQTTCKNGTIFKLVNTLLAEIEKLTTIAADVKYEGRHFSQQEELEQGVHRTVTLQRNIISLNYLTKNNGDSATINLLKTKIEIELTELTNRLG